MKRRSGPSFCNGYRPRRVASQSSQTDSPDSPRLRWRKKAVDQRPSFCECCPPRKWEAPSVSFIDTHCHLEGVRVCELLPAIAHDGRKTYDNWWERGSEGAVALAKHVLDAQPPELLAVISNCCDPLDCKWYEGLAAAWDSGEYQDERLYWSVGVHPYCAEEYEKRLKWDPDIEERMLALAAHPRCVAVGECGLDYCKAYESYEAQRRVFDKVCKMAIRFRKTLVVHARDCPADALRILRANIPTDWPIHLHGYTGVDEDIKVLLDTFSNLCVGFCGALTIDDFHGSCGHCAPTWDANCKFCDGKSEWVSRDLPALIRAVPLDRVLMETDAPFMAPMKYGWATCQPWMLVDTAVYVAEVLGVSVEAVLTASNHNARRLYSLQC